MKDSQAVEVEDTSECLDQLRYPNKCPLDKS